MDEINRNLSDSTPLMGIAINAILVFACLLLGGLPLRRSRVGLGFGAVATILLAPAAGFGLSALLQVPGRTINRVAAQAHKVAACQRVT